MRVLALSDPHLSFGTPGKRMDVFGPEWVDHAGKMAAAWDASVGADDLVLLPGDLSWARTLEQVAPDLAWIAARPGTKIVLKGNHDQWWASRAKVAAALPEGVLAVDADAVRVGDVAVAGTRLWDVPEVAYRYHDLIQWRGEPISPELSEDEQAASLKIYRRELGRLDRALEALDRSAPVRIGIVHYPPVAPGLASNEVTERFERAGLAHVVFGHLHALDPARRDEIGGEARGVRYHLAACDFIDFAPRVVCEA